MQDARKETKKHKQQDRQKWHTLKLTEVEECSASCCMKWQRGVLNHRMKREDTRLFDSQRVETPQIMEAKFLYSKSHWKSETEDTN